MSTEPDYRKFYMIGGSPTVDHYFIVNSTVYVSFKSREVMRSRTLRTPDGLKRALLNGSLTVQPVVQS